MRQLFGTDGIRGKAGEYPLDEPTVFALGQALSDRLSAEGRRPSILLGADTRESGPAIARALAGGIAAGGGDAVFIGVVPTPAVAYLCRTSDCAAGISISASHNPYQDNGVKVFGHDGMKLSDQLEKTIEDELLELRRDRVAVPEADLAGSVQLVRQYEDFLLQGVPAGALDSSTIVLDTGHGASYRIGPEVFRRAGAKVMVINDQPSGRNINELAGAVHPEGLARAVVEAGADFGVAFDGDADRAIFVDDRGKTRNGDEILYLWALREKSEGRLAGARVVATVMSNFGFEKRLAEQGIELLRAQVGDKYVLEMMLRHGAKLGGEQSGHIIDLLVHSTGDGLHTALVMAVLLATEKRRFSEIPTFEAMPQVLLNEPVSSRPPLEELPRYQAEMEAAGSELAGSGRILVRYSGTENVVRVMVEGTDAEQIRRIAGRLVAVLKEEIG